MDFGDIGSILVKIRIEIDGIGELPDLYLNRVELIDANTRQQLTINCNKWLKIKPSADAKVNNQPFREMAISTNVSSLPCKYLI